MLLKQRITAFVVVIDLSIVFYPVCMCLYTELTHSMFFALEGFVECLCHTSPPQHHDDGGAPQVPAEEMSSGV